MKKAIFLFFLGVIGIQLQAQDKVINDANAEMRTVTSFHAIDVSNGIQLILKQGDAEVVAVSAVDKEYRDRIKTEVKNGVLVIYFDHHDWKSWNNNNKKLKAYVSFKQLDKLKGTAGSHTTVDGVVNAGDLNMELASGSTFNGAVKAASLSVDQSSGSHAKISGTSKKLVVETSSGAQFDGYELASETCDAEASSGASIQITVTKEMSAEASSGGGINYKGDGVITKISTSSGGRVKKNS